MLKVVQENLNKQKDIMCSQIARTNFVKMAILPKLIYRFNEIPVRIPVGFAVEIDKMILKLIGKLKGPKIAKTFLKKNTVGSFMISDFKTFYKATVIKSVQHCHRNRQEDERSVMESPEVNPYILVNEYLTRVPRKFNGKEQTSKNGAGTIAHPHAKR